jgi:uncharacterized protein (TIGR02001 family)
MTRLLIVTGLLLAATQPALAQDLSVFSGASLEFKHQPDGAGSGNESSITAYIEAEKAGFYAGLSGSVYDDRTSNEVDLYAGYRQELDSGLSYGAVYTRYIYPNDSDSDYGEIGLSLGQTLGDKASVSLDVYYDHTNELASAYVGADYSLSDKFSVSGSYGTYQNDGAPDEQEWDLGVTYNMTEKSAFDVRYYDGTDYTDSYFGLSLSFDTTLLGG